MIELLAARGAVISYSDPHIPTLPKMRSFDVPELSSEPLTPEYLSDLDCALIATDHTAFDYSAIVNGSELVVDTRNATKNVTENRDRIWKA